MNIVNHGKTGFGPQFLANVQNQRGRVEAAMCHNAQYCAALHCEEPIVSQGYCM